MADLEIKISMIKMLKKFNIFNFLNFGLAKPVFFWPFLEKARKDFFPFNFVYNNLKEKDTIYKDIPHEHFVITAEGSEFVRTIFVYRNVPFFAESVNVTIPVLRLKVCYRTITFHHFLYDAVCYEHGEKILTPYYI